jgi:uncharacterized membrane protein YcaP (DUF421 family)
MANIFSLVEVGLRSTIVYIFILIAIRLFGKKELAQLSVIDLVFILLISNSVQNAMVGSDTSLFGGIVAALALFIVNFVFKKIIYNHPNIGELIQGKPMVLIYDGKIITENLEESEITKAELEAAVREHGIENIEDVNIAMLEVDGNISVVSGEIKNKSFHQTPNKRKYKNKLLKK